MADIASNFCQCLYGLFLTFSILFNLFCDGQFVLVENNTLINQIDSFCQSKFGTNAASIHSESELLIANNLCDQALSNWADGYSLYVFQNH